MGLLVLGILITVHEFGHFLAGRILKFKIKEFSVGMGPKLLQKEKKGTNISLRLIPLGGYVAFDGESDEQEDSPDSFYKQAWWKRVIVMVSGALFNIIFALLVTSILTCTLGYSTVKIAQISDDAPIHSTALEGDIVYAVNGKQMLSPLMFQNTLYEQNGDFDITVLRNGEKITFKTQKYFDDQSNSQKLGISYEEAYLRQNILQSIGYSVKYSIWLTESTYVQLWHSISGGTVKEDLSGPISTVNSMAMLFKNAFSLSAESQQKAVILYQLFSQLLVLLSMNLAIVNLLPLPALDGFKTLFTIIEGITKKHIPRKTEILINNIGLAVLLLFIVYIEVSKLFV